MSAAASLPASPLPTRGLCCTGSVATIAGFTSSSPLVSPSSPTEHVAIPAPLQCLIERGGYTLLDVRPELELDVVRCLRPCVPRNILLCLACDHASGTLPGSACAQSSRQAAAVARPTWHCTCLWRQPATTSPLHCLHTHSVQRSHPPAPPANPPPNPYPHPATHAPSFRARRWAACAAAPTSRCSTPAGCSTRRLAPRRWSARPTRGSWRRCVGGCMCGGLGSG